MKLLVPLCLVLNGCQTSVPALPPGPSAPLKIAPVSAEPRSTPPASPALEAKVRLQTQYIEALLSQNEALVAKLATPSAVAPAAVVTAIPASPPATVPPAPSAPTLAPNADGLIDLTAVPAEKSGEPVNPFTVRLVPENGTVEVSLVLSGIVAGPVPSAILNDRLVRPGDIVESLEVQRIDSDAVLLKAADKLIRLTVSEKKIRVRTAR